MFGMIVYFIDAHLLVPRSRLSVKVRGQISMSQFSKGGHIGGISVSQTKHPRKRGKGQWHDIWHLFHLFQRNLLCLSNCECIVLHILEKYRLCDRKNLTYFGFSGAVVLNTLPNECYSARKTVVTFNLTIQTFNNPEKKAF